jgi:hypothetical protein
MKDAAILLFNFSGPELTQWKKQTPPGIRVVPVEPSAYGLTVQQVLDGETAGPAAPAFFRKMLVLSGTPDPLVHYLLNLCRQITAEPVLRAMTTETNLQWSCRTLYENLLEEDRQLH